MIKIVTDSVASIPADMIADKPIEIVTLYVNRDGVEYADATMDLDAFYGEIYDMLDDIPTSSQPSQQELEDVFERSAQAGDEVLGIFISSELSGTFEGAIRAARAVAARNISFSYRIINSASAGFDEGWAVFAAAEAAMEGKTLDECADAALTSIA